jgi:hypothetical protein
MYLDAAKETYDFKTVPDASVETSATVSAEYAVFDKWRDFPVSRFSHHGEMCCEIAREWLFAMDFSQLGGGSRLTGPRWIRQRYNWGPTRWQIHWCEAIDRKTLDCGAQAALAHEVFTMRGVRSYPVQLVQQYSKEATAQWTKRWDGEETSLYWINEDLIYHEGCAVVIGSDTEIKIWDASAAWWINPRHYSGYGALRALCLHAHGRDTPLSFNWGARRITPNQWQKT